MPCSCGNYIVDQLCRCSTDCWAEHAESLDGCSGIVRKKDEGPVHRLTLST